MTTDSHAPDNASPALRWEPLNPGWLARGQEYDYLIHRDNHTGRLMLARRRRTAAQPGSEMALVKEIMATGMGCVVLIAPGAGPAVDEVVVPGGFRRRLLPRGGDAPVVLAGQYAGAAGFVVPGEFLGRAWVIHFGG